MSSSRHGALRAVIQSCSSPVGAVSVANVFPLTSSASGPILFLLIVCLENIDQIQATGHFTKCRRLFGRMHL